MKKHDPTIEEKLDEFAACKLPPADKILLPARSAMREKSKREKKTAARRRIFGGVGLGAGALAVCLLFVFALLPALKNMFFDAPSSGGADAVRPRVFSAYELTGEKTDAESLLSLGISVLPLNETVNAKIGLFRYKATGETVMIKYEMRVKNANGYFDDVVIYAETDGLYRYDKNRSYANLPAQEYEGLTYRASTVYENGEYVSRAEVYGNEYRYCMNILNPRPGDGVKPYLDAFFVSVGAQA